MKEIDDYIESHIEAEHPYLHALWRATYLHLNYPRMASGHLQGELLRMLVQMAKPHTVLEVGTFTGYAALSMASALDDDAHLYTVEVYDEQEDFTRPWIDGSPWADKVTFIIGDIMELLKGAELPEMFDFVFIDANKRYYIEYYEALLPRVSPGGFILADNTLWDGHVVETDRRASDLKAHGIMDFNNHIANDTRVEKVILPLRDGLTIIRKK
ncbi:MAG: class I SAM-dependent methyltransferase [Bacteroidaceae bacterium]|nr:class I SAM-dependent methyltransferase [Bacteroidaceae bacterium]